MYDPYAEFTKNVLPNGLEVNSVFWDRPWIEVSVAVHSGGREDPTSLSGLAHFVEHLVSKNIPDWEYDSAKEFFETVGGKVMFGATNYLATYYKFAIPADSSILKEALTIFGSMLLQGKMEKHVERERKVILREFNQRYPFLEKLEWDTSIRKALFKGHRLETWNRPLGRPEHFGIATESDLQNFYDTRYVPANMSLVVVGGFQTAEVLAALGESPFGMQKVGGRNPVWPSLTKFVIPEEHSRIVKMSDYANFKVDQTEYNAVWAFPIDFSRPARRVFDRMLGKILFDEIRQKRELAYSFGTNLVNYEDVFEYVVSGRVSPEVTNGIGEIVRKCIEEIPTRKDLFEQVLKSCIQKCYMLDQSGGEIVTNSTDDLIYRRRIIPIQEEWDELQTVTFDQMAEAAALLSPKHQYTFIISP